MQAINNAIYDELGVKWYEADDDPVALLRAEARLRNPWICRKIRLEFSQAKLGSKKSARILDVGCGAGFLSNELAKDGHDIVGVDLSDSSLKVAQAYDLTQSVKYLSADATKLPFEDRSFDVVCSMDLLEHTENPDAVISEASRVLRPGGYFFFYTFNRTFLSWLLAIKALEWFVKNTPKNLHVYHLFIKPKELLKMCSNSDLEVELSVGIKPVIFSQAVWELLLKGNVSPDFKFEFTRFKACGYLFYGRKKVLLS